MEIKKHLPPIAVSALLTKKIKLALEQEGGEALSKSIMSAYERDRVLNLVVSDALARSELRMYGELILHVATEIFWGGMDEYSLRIQIWRD